MTLLSFAVVVLFIAVIALSVGFFALARQVGVLFERIEPMGALVTDSGPKVGEAAQPFHLPGLTGGLVQIGGTSVRSVLLFFLSPSCPVCKKLLPVLHSIRAAESAWLEIVLASDGERDKHKRYIENAGLQTYPYVLSAELGMTYRVARLPFAVLIDPAGVIRAKGLVNNREQLESLFNAHEMNVASIQQFMQASPGVIQES
jgi:methylamine dehydrogenase accessory protein MauD